MGSWMNLTEEEQERYTLAYERIRQIGNFDAKPYMEGQGEEIQEKRQEALQVLLQL